MMSAIVIENKGQAEIIDLLVVAADVVEVDEEEDVPCLRKIIAWDAVAIKATNKNTKMTC
jgi:hypothetical protein